MLKYELFFLCDLDEILDNKIVLKSDEVNHIQRVLRKKIGDKLHLSNGVSHYYDVKLSTFGQKSISFEILKKHEIKKEKMQLILYPALLKGSHFDLLLEKSIELGVSAIQPLISDHVIAIKNKIDKWQKIALKAQKQCKQVRHIPIYEAKALSEVKTDTKWIVPEIFSESKRIDEILFQKNEDICIFIGPEGGFSEKEIQFFKTKNAHFLSLGTLRLRAETAAWKSISIVSEQMEGRK